MNKKVVFGLTALAIAGVGVDSTFSPKVQQWLEERALVQAEQEKYNEALDTVVSYMGLFVDETSEKADWILEVADPRTAPLAEWDNPGDKPQIITQIYRAENRKQAGLYTMDLDGSNLQTLLTPEEVGSLVSFNKNLRPQRSPNGRFLFFNMGLFVTLKGCVVADLKTRQIERFGGDCNFGGWLPDSSKAYMSQLGKAYEFDTAAMVMSRLAIKLPNPYTEDIDRSKLTLEQRDALVYDRVRYIKLIESGQKLLVDVKTTYNDPVLSQAGNTSSSVVYQVGDWQNYMPERFYPQECVLASDRTSDDHRPAYIYWREDGGAFSCNTKNGYRENTKNAYRAFSTQDMTQSTALIGDSRSSRYALQLGVLSGKESIAPRLMRVRQAGEKSPIDELTYMYQTAVIGDDVNGFSLYVPASLQSNFSDYDLTQDLPTLPSHSQYKKAYARYLEAQPERCKEIDYGEWTSLEIRRCERTCQIER